jgi:hypothetical protein
MKPPPLFYLLKIPLAIQSLLCFQMNFGTVSSTSVKNAIRVFIGILLNLWIALDSAVILTILILLNHEHGVPVQFLLSGLIRV